MRHTKTALHHRNYESTCYIHFTSHVWINKSKHELVESTLEEGAQNQLHVGGARRQRISRQGPCLLELATNVTKSDTVHAEVCRLQGRCRRVSLSGGRHLYKRSTRGWTVELLQRNPLSSVQHVTNCCSLLRVGADIIHGCDVDPAASANQRQRRRQRQVKRECSLRGQALPPLPTTTACRTLDRLPALHFRATFVPLFDSKNYLVWSAVPDLRNCHRFAAQCCLLSSCSLVSGDPPEAHPRLATSSRPSTFCDTRLAT